MHWLADFVVDVANDDAGDEVLDKEADDGVGEVRFDALLGASKIPEHVDGWVMAICNKVHLHN